jgi:hypothetical protein
MFYFRDYKHYFCLPLTLFIFNFGKFLISGTFLPRQWSLALLSSSVLTKLESLTLWFQPPPTHLDQTGGPSTHTHLPILTKLDFRGHGQYLEDLVTRIDSPLLEELYIKFDHQSTFDTPKLAHFIRRTPKFKAHDEECVVFFKRVTLPQTFGGKLDVKIFS